MNIWGLNIWYGFWAEVASITNLQNVLAIKFENTRMSNWLGLESDTGVIVSNKDMLHFQSKTSMVIISDFKQCNPLGSNFYAIQIKTQKMNFREKISCGDFKPLFTPWWPIKKIYFKFLFCWHGLTLFLSLISKYIHHYVRGDITYPFLKSQWLKVWDLWANSSRTLLGITFLI